MKVHVKNKLLMGVVFFSLIFLAGCGTLETLVNKDGNATALGNFIGGNKSESLPASAGVSTGETAGTTADPKAIALYFADSTGKYLVKEERTLPNTMSLARETVTQWLKGPTGVKGTTVQAQVPKTTELIDIAIKENVVIVDLSKEFLQPNSKVSPEVALYGLVNTLTQFSTIKQVQIRIEGKPLTKYGTIDATKLVRKASLIKGTSANDPIFPSSGTGKSAGSSSGSSGSGSGVETPGKASNSALPNSPSSVNLFNYPPSST
ncbi:MAG: GerMN domain-containing protein [Bacillota bacterium]|nr:GerMN domain-containing protein [Bacillota bacterium]